MTYSEGYKKVGERETRRKCGRKDSDERKDKELEKEETEEGWKFS